MIMFVAISTLHNLLLCKNEANREELDIRERAKNAVRAAGGVKTLAILLKRDDKDKLRTIVIDCLRILSTQHAETKKVILDHNGPRILVDIMRRQTMREDNYKNLTVTTSRLLKGSV